MAAKIRIPPPWEKVAPPNKTKRPATVRVSGALLGDIDAYAERWDCEREEAVHKLLSQALRGLNHANKRKR